MKIRRSNSSEMLQEKSMMQTTGKKKRLEQQIQEQQFLKIYLRVRPIRVAQNIYSINSDSKGVKINKANNEQEFGFNHVFDERSSQQNVFDNVCKPVLKEMFYKQNSNSLMFTYGVTNSGKTYTTFGDVGCPGILPNLLSLILEIRDKVNNKKTSLYPDLNIDSDHIFDKLVFKDSNKELADDFDLELILNNKNGYLQQMEVYLEAFEIYNEQIKDLSQPNHCARNPPKKELQQTRLT